jgi:hypothetical protein
MMRVGGRRGAAGSMLEHRASCEALLLLLLLLLLVVVGQVRACCVRRAARRAGCQHLGPDLRASPCSRSRGRACQRSEAAWAW